MLTTRRSLPDPHRPSTLKRMTPKNLTIGIPSQLFRQQLKPDPAQNRRLKRYSHQKTEQRETWDDRLLRYMSSRQKVFHRLRETQQGRDSFGELQLDKNNQMRRKNMIKSLHLSQPKQDKFIGKPSNCFISNLRNQQPDYLRCEFLMETRMSNYFNRKFRKQRRDYISARVMTEATDTESEYGRFFTEIAED